MDDPLCFTGLGSFRIRPPLHFIYKTIEPETNKKHRMKPWVKQFISVTIMIVISIGISLLLRHFFFGGTGNDDDNNNEAQNIFGPQDNNNALRTFAKDKHEIDGVCSRTTLAKYEGTLCKEACIDRKSVV